MSEEKDTTVNSDGVIVCFLSGWLSLGITLIASHFIKDHYLLVGIFFLTAFFNFLGFAYWAANVDEE
jgi:hypothetical protein